MWVGSSDKEVMMLVDLGRLRGRLRWIETSRLLHERVGRETDSSDEYGRDAAKQRPAGRHRTHFLHPPSVTFTHVIDMSSTFSRPSPTHCRTVSHQHF